MKICRYSVAPEEKHMTRIGVVAVILALGATPAPAQESTPVGTVITAAEVAATIEAAPSGRVSDQQIRMVDAGGHNVGVGVVQRPPTTTMSAIEHHNQTEVYRVVSGRGTLVTGGTLIGARALDPQGAVVRQLTGPSAVGTIEGGNRQPVGPGDVVIIPAGAPHGFSEISETITYLVVRVDPDQLVELKPE